MDAAALKIAVLRANGLGDLLFALPALEALRAHYPQAEIVLLGRGLHRDFFARRPSPVDRVEVVPPMPGIVDAAPASPGEIEEFVRRMREERFDVAVQLHGGGRHSNPLVRSLGASLTVGLATPDAAPLDVEVPYLYYQHEVHRYLEVVAQLGAAPVSFRPCVEPTEADLRDAELLLGPPDHDPPVVLHPGAGDPRRRWDPGNFAAVGDALARAGATVAVVGDDGERALCREVAERMEEDALDLGGACSLSALTGVLARAVLAVCNDSGPLHLATALDRPAVGIFWCGNLINAGAPFRSRFRPCLSWRLHCPVCGTDCTEAECRHDASFVDRVPVAEVLGHALELFPGEGREPATTGGSIGDPVRG